MVGLRTEGFEAETNFRGTAARMEKCQRHELQDFPGLRHQSTADPGREVR